MPLGLQWEALEEGVEKGTVVSTLWAMGRLFREEGPGVSDVEQPGRLTSFANYGRRLLNEMVGGADRPHSPEEHDLNPQLGPSWKVAQASSPSIEASSPVNSPLPFTLGQETPTPRSRESSPDRAKFHLGGGLSKTICTEGPETVGPKTIWAEGPKTERSKTIWKEGSGDVKARTILTEGPKTILVPDTQEQPARAQSRAVGPQVLDTPVRDRALRREWEEIEAHRRWLKEREEELELKYQQREKTILDKETRVKLDRRSVTYRHKQNEAQSLQVELAKARLEHDLDNHQRRMKGQQVLPDMSYLKFGTREHEEPRGLGRTEDTEIGRAHV